LSIGNKKHFLEIEAKQIFIGPKAEAAGSLSTKLQSACSDAKQLWWGAQRAGLLFAVLSLPRDQVLQFDLRRFKNELALVRSDLSWYWYDTSSGQKYRWSENNHYYPGLGVLLKEVVRPSG
jgi:hypothetical protein